MTYRFDPFRKKLDSSPLQSDDQLLTLISLRRARNAVFGKALFSDPAWDILLELSAARLREGTMVLSELAREIETPVQTTTRWLAALGERGLVSVRTNRSDPDEVEVELTTEAVSKLNRLFRSLGSH